MAKGLKVFGLRGIEAVQKEVKQLQDRRVLDPNDVSRMTKEEKETALQYLMFLKKKHCGTIKGQGCADGRPQRVYISKEETSAPTVLTEALILSCIIDTVENREVTVCNIPGAFMHADMEREVHVKLEGKMAEMMYELNPAQYKKAVCKENGKTVLYARMVKALYGTLEAALLFWKNLTMALKEWGFEINPYNWCVANKNINGTQCTIVWHVYDLKISHAKPSVVTGILETLKEKYGEEAPLTISRVKPTTTWAWNLITPFQKK